MTPDDTGAFDADATQQESGAWRVVARGELDVASADQLARTLDPLIESGATLVALDLADVTFLDSSGLRTIVRAATALEDHDGRLVVDGASPAVARVLEVTGLLERLRGENGQPAGDAA
jgi:anti-sigma B factor antagonist